MWLLIFLVVPLIGMAFPGFVNFLNWGVLFPIALIAAGSMAWVVVNLLTGFSAMSMGGWVACLVVFGLPMAIWTTKVSLE